MNHPSKVNALTYCSSQVAPIEGLKISDRELWRVHLEAMVARAEEAIVHAQMRIERRRRLAPVGGDPWQQRLT
jgi:hypothetical protein